MFPYKTFFFGCKRWQPHSFFYSVVCLMMKSSFSRFGTLSRLDWSFFGVYLVNIFFFQCYWPLKIHYSIYPFYYNRKIFVSCESKKLVNLPSFCRHKWLTLFISLTKYLKKNFLVCYFIRITNLFILFHSLFAIIAYMNIEMYFFLLFVVSRVYISILFSWHFTFVVRATQTFTFNELSLIGSQSSVQKMRFFFFLFFSFWLAHCWVLC